MTYLAALAKEFVELLLCGVEAHVADVQRCRLRRDGTNKSRYKSEPGCTNGGLRITIY